MKKRGHFYYRFSDNIFTGEEIVEKFWIPEESPRKKKMKETYEDKTKKLW